MLVGRDGREDKHGDHRVELPLRVGKIEIQRQQERQRQRQTETETEAETEADIEMRDLVWEILDGQVPNEGLATT